MESPAVVTRGAMRAVRSSVFAITSTALTCAAHAVGSGELPDTGTALLLTAMVAAAGTAMADRQRRTPAILATLGVVQVVLHVMLTWLAGLGGHHPASSPSWAMVAGHVGAALATGLVLARADAAVFAVARVLTALFPRRPTPFAAHRPLWVSTDSADFAVAITVVLRHVCARRGPPLPF